jgi:hypothetical protein
MSSLEPPVSRFDLWYALIQKLPPAADDRWRAIAIWNAALESAIENIGLDKGLFITEAKYYEAAIIRDAQARIKNLKETASIRPILIADKG